MARRRRGALKWMAVIVVMMAGRIHGVASGAMPPPQLPPNWVAYYHEGKAYVSVYPALAG